ncbi:MAG: preprotein translocase subunit SecY [Anaerolineae bacterium CG_4_9_14_3_um_filter_57_17]|nr:preprotein translocase subunit SecY [bacterium]NCT20910.1 preprotein translocase subunit SecY [bacterium]OIO85034.1 MAG: preprotein translocase subunit SecY [Anaerolineae bacterium CG2_30_57_67]PJB68059.1 MAG: preprotein translocase subunit SecY [Anaerolineae bacterium CG_4_9_14_3_um_filter_57_17]
MKNTWTAWRYLWKSDDIRRMLLVSLGLLAIYRLAANLPVPGVDVVVLAQMRAFIAQQGNFVQFLNLLSGGTITNFSILSMGVYPYITAQIILQLMVPIIPSLQKRMEENPTEGRKWMEKWTYYLSVPMAALSAIGQINIFNQITLSQPNIGKKVIEFSFVGSPETILASATVLISMIAGTMFAIWIGELISEYGIRGQGLSLVIFAGIVAQMPSNIISIFQDQATWPIMLTLMIVVILATILAIVYIQQGRRNVPVMYPGRRVGNRMSMPVKASMPLMVNLAGMIPLIFASAILQFPAILSAWFLTSTNLTVSRLAQQTQSLFSANSATYWILYFVMVVAFTFFYTDVLFAQQNYGDNLKRAGAQIPGVERGKRTQDYLSRVQRRITLPGALFLGLIAILPFIISQGLQLFGIGSLSSSSGSGLFLASSSGLLIVVGVVRDTFSVIDAELKLHGYQDSILVR